MQHVGFDYYKLYSMITKIDGRDKIIKPSITAYYQHR